VLERSLIGLRTLIDRSLADVRVAAGMLPQHELVSVSDFIDQIGISALLEAGARGCKFTVSPVEEGLAVDVDRDMLLSALGNLLQNAFKFTRLGTDVSLSAFAVADRILIEVEDHCGGLPPGSAARIFAPFAQAGADKSGLGLGLAICQRSVEANNGVLRVRDKPGSGCVFTIELPRKTIR
jgi:signal transduction histidine kinase